MPGNNISKFDKLTFNKLVKAAQEGDLQSIKSVFSKQDDVTIQQILKADNYSLFRDAEKGTLRGY